MKDKISKFFFSTLVILNFNCCSTIPQYKEVNDFSQTQIIELDSEKRDVYFRTITFEGNINGKILISLRDNGDSVMTLSGKIKQEYKNDWYSAKTIIEIRPLMPTIGHLKIGYKTTSTL
jgi:hypothetical protein